MSISLLKKVKALANVNIELKEKKSIKTFNTFFFAVTKNHQEYATAVEPSANFNECIDFGIGSKDLSDKFQSSTKSCSTKILTFNWIEYPQILNLDNIDL